MGSFTDIDESHKLSRSKAARDLFAIVDLVPGQGISSASVQVQDNGTSSLVDEEIVGSAWNVTNQSHLKCVVTGYTYRRR